MGESAYCREGVLVATLPYARGLFWEAFQEITRDWGGIIDAPIENGCGICRIAREEEKYRLPTEGPYFDFWDRGGY